ncbi:MAG: hypothetical protein KGZ39_04975 [Simkania sp.]|nr:hypothetical protein [Simkania sp.]
MLSQTELQHLPVTDLAMLGFLPERLSIKEIVSMYFSGECEKKYTTNVLRCIQTSLMNQLITACEANDLLYEGDIKGWVYTDTNPYSLARGGCFVKYNDPKFYMEINVFSKPTKKIQEQSNKDQIPKSDIKADYFACSPGDCTIHKSEFERFLKTNELWPVENCLLTAWWTNDEILCNEPDSENITQEDDCSKGRRNMQVQHISELIVKIGFDPLNIPLGGKQAIETICLNTKKNLFTKDGFKRAWQKANQLNLTRVHNKEGYCQTKL